MNRVYKYDIEAVIPTKAHKTDAGWDLYSIESVFIPCGKTILINTGVAVEVGEGSYAKISDRSSLASKGLYVGGGVIDAHFSGPIKVILTNLTNVQDKEKYDVDMDENLIYEYGYNINKGDRIAQLVFHKFENVTLVEVKELWQSERGSKGLGSSGR